MKRSIPGFPVIDDGAKETSASPSVSVAQAMALAAARDKQVLDYTRQKQMAPTHLKENLRTDGPTLELWMKAGHTADTYPPSGYAELDSPALQAYKAMSAGQKTAPAPHSVTDKKAAP